MVVLVVLLLSPSVESLVYDQQAEAVAGMEEAFRRRVVRCAYGIISGRLHQFYLPYLRLVEGCGTKDAVVVMYTSTVEQQRSVRNNFFIFRMLEF